MKDLVELVNVTIRRFCEPIDAFSDVDFTHSRPLKIGFPPNSSARIQPTDQTSIAVVCKGNSETLQSPKNPIPTHVVCETQHDLRSTVPSSSDIFGHKSLVPSRLRSSTTRCVPTSKAKITDFELAVGVDEKISRFKITVKNVRGMDVLETAKGLVKERLEVGIGERLARANLSTDRTFMSDRVEENG